MTISLPGRAAAMPRSENQRADKDTKYTGRWTSCKLLPHSLNGSELSTLRSGQRTAHVHTAIQRTSGWYNFSAVFPIVAAESATRLHRIQRERAYARHTIVLQETLERAGNGDRAVHLRLPTGETCPAPRIQSGLYDRLWNRGRAGFPDLDQLTMGKMVENVRTLARSVDISVICDADTGYDEAINVQRTVREYEDRREAIWPK